MPWHVSTSFPFQTEVLQGDCRTVVCYGGVSAGCNCVHAPGTVLGLQLLGDLFKAAASDMMSGPQFFCLSNCTVDDYLFEEWSLKACPGKTLTPERVALVPGPRTSAVPRRHQHIARSWRCGQMCCQTKPWSCPARRLGRTHQLPSSNTSPLWRSASSAAQPKLSLSSA